MRRVPDVTLQRHLLTQIQVNSDRLQRRQVEVATGRRIHRPSDDVPGAARAITAESGLRRMEGLGRATDRTGFLAGAIESGISAVNDTLAELRVLATEAGNDASDPSMGAEALAEQVNHLLESVLETANRRVLDRYVFGGAVTDTPPYGAVRDPDGTITAVAPTSGIDEPLIRTVGDSQLEIPVTGPRVFADGGDLFQTVIDLRDAILSDDSNAIADAAARLDEIETHTAVQQARIGSFINQIDSATGRLAENAVNLEAERSRVVDTDMAEAVVKLSAEETFYQAALQMAARISHLNLMNYL